MEGSYEESQIGDKVEKQYLMIMIDSLNQKIQVLNQISIKNEEQTEILKKDPMFWETFDQISDQKVELIEQLQKLDDGFENLYEKVKELLQSENAKMIYSQEIKQMQMLIQNITEKSISIQASEARNKQLIENYFQKSKEKIKTGRTSSKAAMDYYKNMRQMTFVDPQFLDHKK